jgi:ubiquinone/menaquinone biosynthesis C-methylase UbiE
MKERYELNQLRGKDVFAILNQHKDSIDEYFWKYYENYTIKKFEEYIRDICCFTKPKGKVISIGCGHGLNEVFMADMCNDIEEIHGLDIVQEKIISMNKIIDILNLKNIESIVGNAIKIRFPNEKFDTVIIIESLSHINDQNQVLKEAVRVLQKGGLIFILDFNNGANPRILYKCWKENRKKGIDERPVNPYFIRSRLKDLGIGDIIIKPYLYTPLFDKLGIKLIFKDVTWFHLLWTRGFMLKGKK